MKIEKERIKSVTLESEEVNQLYRLLKNECEYANQSTDRTTYEMYRELKPYFGE